MKFKNLIHSRVVPIRTTQFVVKLDSRSVETEPLRQMSMYVQGVIFAYSCLGAVGAGSPLGKAVETRTLYNGRWGAVEADFLSEFKFMNRHYPAGREFENWLKQPLSPGNLAAVFKRMNAAPANSTLRAARALILGLALGRRIDHTDNYMEYTVQFNERKFLEDILGKTFLPPVNTRVATQDSDAEMIIFCNALFDRSQHCDIYSDAKDKHVLADLTLELRKVLSRSKQLVAGGDGINGIQVMKAEQVWYRLFDILTVTNQERIKAHDLPNPKEILCEPMDYVLQYRKILFEEWMGTLPIFQERMLTYLHDAQDWLSDQLAFASYKPRTSVHASTANSIMKLMDGSTGKKLMTTWKSKGQALRRGLAPLNIREGYLDEMTTDQYTAAIEYPTTYIDYVTVGDDPTMKGKRTLRVQGAPYMKYEVSGQREKHTLISVDEELPSYFLVESAEDVDCLFDDAWRRDLALLMEVERDSAEVAIARELRKHGGATVDVTGSKLRSELIAVLDSEFLKPDDYLVLKADDLKSFTQYADDQGFEVVPVRVTGNKPEGMVVEVEPGEYVQFIKPSHVKPGQEPWHPVEDWRATSVVRSRDDEDVIRDQRMLHCTDKSLDGFSAVMTQNGFSTYRKIPAARKLSVWIRVLNELSQLGRSFKTERKMFTKKLAERIGKEVSDSRVSLPVGMECVGYLAYATVPRRMLRLFESDDQRKIAKEWFVARCVAEFVGEANQEASKQDGYGSISTTTEFEGADSEHDQLRKLFSDLWEEAFKLVDEDSWLSDDSGIIAVQPD